MQAREANPAVRFRRVLTGRGPLGVAAMALAVGIGGAFSSVLFAWAIEGVSHLVTWLIAHLSWIGLIGAAALGGLIVGLMVYFFAREAKGHGVPEVMAAIALRGGRIRPRVVAVKGIASAITIATGGSAGREGPIVQVGAALGSTIGQWFKVSEGNLKTLVACGAAAGIAATFNAPIGGVFFAMEVILGDWDGARFGLITLSSVAAAALAHAIMGDHPALVELSYTLKSAWELGLYVLLGVFIMLVAQLYTRVLYYTEDLFDESKRVPDWVKPAIGGVLFGVLGLVLPVTLGRGEDVVHALLSGHLPEQVSGWTMLGPALILLLVGLGKILSTSLTIGSGGSGGIFFPGLFIGAAFGGSFGHVANAVAPGVTASPGAYALVGMGAFFAGMTHAPITAIVMLFEMTRDYRIILPLMLTSAVAATLSRWVHPESIYTLKLVRQGIRLRRGQEVGALQSLTAADVMIRKVDVVHETDTVGDVIAFMQRTHHTGFPVLDDEERLVGIISLSDIRRIPLHGRLERKVSSVMTRPVIAVPPTANLEMVTQIMTQRDIGRVPVIDPDGDDRLLGFITRSNILNAYNTKLLEREAQS
ncbi:MAG: chloride channel protein [Bacillota bacterium]